VACREAPAGCLEWTSNFSIVVTPESGSSSPLTSGLCSDLVEVATGGAQLRQRGAVSDADADADVLPRYVVSPF